MTIFKTLFLKIGLILILTTFFYTSIAEINLNFSKQRGFNETPFNLTITSEKATNIKYTLDGSQPNLNSLDVPDNLAINSNTVVRVLAYNATDTIQETHTYLFLDEVINQSNQSIISKGYPTKWGIGPSKSSPNTIIDQDADYEMDVRVTQNPAYKEQLKEGLKQIPTLSLSLHMDSLFHPDKGIYSNSLEEDSTFFLNNNALIEKPVSIEMFDGDTTKFHTFAGLKMNGASTRYYDFYKHALRIVFRKKFGDGKLDYALYGENAAKDHESLVLRMIGHCSPNDWVESRREKTQFQKDKLARDLHRKMGHLSPNSKFVHLYLNGIYWGLYDLIERVDNDYLAEYKGGKKEEYDVIKQLEVKDGDSIAYYKLFHFSNNSPSKTVETKEQYDSIAHYLDIPAFADYILLNHYLINSDWGENNWIAARKRKNGEKFQFFVWDAEFVLLNKIFRNLVINHQTNLHPAGLHRDLEDYREYRVVFGDRVQCNCLETDGALYDIRPDVLNLEKSIDKASLAELARWGDVRGTLVDYNTHIVATRDEIVNDLLPTQLEAVMGVYTREGYSLYPKIAAVQFNHLGGFVNNGFQIELNNPNTSGDIYYTLDGSDPRLEGGALNPNAMLYTGPITVNKFTLVSARVYNPGNFNPQYNWSAMCPRQFFSNDTYTLIINEIQYNPPAVTLANGNIIDGDEYEFVEIKNIGDKVLDLSNVFFSAGIEYTFPLGTTLQPNEFWVIAENKELFHSIYNFIPNDKYSGKLSNGGEMIVLNSPDTTKIDDVNFNDKLPWPLQPDGEGPSLSLMPGFEANNDVYYSWASSQYCTPNAENVFCNPIKFNVGLSGIDCEVEPNASISVSPTGGVAPYTYQWKKDDMPLNTSNTQASISNIVPDKYTVTITDNLGCAYTEVIEVNPTTIDENLVLDNNIRTGIYKVAQTITAVGSINANTNVEFRADTITLFGGFEAHKLSDLFIDIDPCQ